MLILLLLWFSIRNLRNILLIAISIAWGWLFALAALSLIHSEVSLIVIGISSVIVGIAVNYPLHLISHLSHTPDVRQALREISKPLVVGNITTVGAFLALVPLQSVALRDLGLFSSFLLIGTILFTLLWLPHFVKQTAQSSWQSQAAEPSAKLKAQSSKLKVLGRAKRQSRAQSSKLKVQSSWQSQAAKPSAKFKVFSPWSLGSAYDSLRLLQPTHLF